MALRIWTIVLVAAIAASVIGGDEPKCSASARECEEQIRQMLSGRRYLGATIHDRHPGLYIDSVRPHSPAERGGLQPGDRLIALNGKPLTRASSREFKQYLADARETGKLWIIVQRHGAYVPIEARLEPYSKEQINKIIAVHLAQSHSGSSTTTTTTASGGH